MTSRFPVVERTAAFLVTSVLARPPTLGVGRLVCVDGPAGSGKTTLAAALRRGFRDALRAEGAPADPSAAVTSGGSSEVLTQLPSSCRLSSYAGQ